MSNAEVRSDLLPTGRGSPETVERSQWLGQIWLDRGHSITFERCFRGGLRTERTPARSRLCEQRTTTVAPRLFETLRNPNHRDCGNRPDGRNINLACGSTHPEHLAAAVVNSGCDMGVAFDGDGDRAIFVDHSGRDRQRRCCRC